jgi:hypothetical protein
VANIDEAGRGGGGGSVIDARLRDVGIAAVGVIVAEDDDDDNDGADSGVGIGGRFIADRVDNPGRCGMVGADIVGTLGGEGNRIGEGPSESLDSDFFVSWLPKTYVYR